MTRETFAIGDTIRQSHIVAVNDLTNRLCRLREGAIKDGLRLAQADKLAEALRNAVDVMGPMAKYPKVNPWLIESEKALADWENAT